MPPGPNIAKQAEVLERRAEVVRLKARGIPYREIAARLGVSEEVARQDAHRAYKARAQEMRDSVDEDVAAAIEKLDAAEQVVWRIILTKHRKVGATGVAAKDEQGNPIYDDEVNLHGIDRLVKLEERRAKLLGSDAALKVDMKAQVVTIDALDAAILGLRQQLEEEERANGA